MDDVLGRSRTSGQAPGQSVGVLTSLPASGLPGFLELNHTVPASQSHPTLHPNRAIHRAHCGPPDSVELLQCVGRTCHGLMILISDTTGKSLPGPSWRPDRWQHPTALERGDDQAALAWRGSRRAHLASQGPPHASAAVPQAGHAWSTFGPHTIGFERFAMVSNGGSFALVAGAILGEQGPGSRTLIGGSLEVCRHSYPCALYVSRQAGQVVGGRRPWPRAACGGPAGCWLRCRQNVGGGPGR